MQIEIKKLGSGEAIHKGQIASVHYTGWLSDSTKFDSSHDRKKPLEFKLGQKEVIRGWDLGIEGMKVGEIRKLTVSPELGYGSSGTGSVIPPNSTLVFEIELLEIKN